MLAPDSDKGSMRPVMAASGAGMVLTGPSWEGMVFSWSMCAWRLLRRWLLFVFDPGRILSVQSHRFTGIDGYPPYAGANKVTPWSTQARLPQVFQGLPGQYQPLVRL